MKKIAVLGAGSFGCAIANTLSKNNHDVTIWAHQQEEADLINKTHENPFIKGAKINPSIFVTSDLNVVNEVEYIVYVVPSFALRQTSKKINEILKEEKKFVICTKGLEAETMKSGYDIVLEEIKKVKDIAILSGPTHAEEMAFDKYTTIVSTAKKEEYAKEIQRLFNNEVLRVYTNTDVAGVELMGAAKNVLAIAAGICDSHPELGDNAKAALLTRGLREITIIAKSQGHNVSTIYGLTGMGDLIVTATSKHSRNRKFGELLGKGLSAKEAQEKVGMVVEGIYSVRALQQLNEETKNNLPIIEGIYSLLFEEKPIKEIIVSGFSRDMKNED